MSLKFLVWVLRLVAAGIMLQTLWFKFSGAEESVYIFSTLGVEPWGRISVGILELVASILILLPATTAYGALLALGLMTGALFAHCTTLGLVVMDDGGLLFIYATIVWISGALLIWINRGKLVKIIASKQKTSSSAI